MRNIHNGLCGRIGENYFYQNQQHEKLLLASRTIIYFFFGIVNVHHECSLLPQEQGIEENNF